MFYIREKDIISYESYLSSDQVKEMCSKDQQLGFGKFYIQVQGYHDNQVFSIIELNGPDTFYCRLEDLARLKGRERDQCITSLSTKYNISWISGIPKRDLVLKFTLVLRVLGRSHKYLMLERYNSKCHEKEFVGNFCALLAHTAYKWYYEVLIGNSIKMSDVNPSS